LQIRHRQFHVEAGAIVRLVEKGKLKQAQALLRIGDYTKYSIAVQDLIGALFVKVTDIKVDGAMR
jgi:3-dehydroquinate dehydratase